MTLLSVAASSLPINLELYAEKIFSIVGFIVIPLLAILLILLSVLMCFFIVGLFLDFLGISISLPFVKKNERMIIMFLKLRTVYEKTILLNSKMITKVTFDADPEHRTIIHLIDDADFTVIDGPEAFKDINRDDG